MLEQPRYKQILNALSHILRNGGKVDDDGIVMGDGRVFKDMREGIDCLLQEVPELRTKEPIARNFFE